MAGGQVAGLRWMGSFLADRCVAAFVLLAASSLPPGLVLADTSSPRLRIEAPAAPVSTSAVEWIEVRGQGGARNHGAHAVVIALDVSNSTRIPATLRPATVSGIVTLMRYHANVSPCDTHAARSSVDSHDESS